MCVGGRGHQKTAFTRLKLMFGKGFFLTPNASSPKTNCCWRGQATNRSGHIFNNFWEVVKVKVCKDGRAGLKALSMPLILLTVECSLFVGDLPLCLYHKGMRRKTVRTGAQLKATCTTRQTRKLSHF